MRYLILLSALIILSSGCTNSLQKPNLAELKEQVSETERAFAKTMADRDHVAFTSFLSDEAIFFSGPEPLRGKQQVADWWQRYYEAQDAPFFWEPKKVEVLNSGTLALSSGPVWNSDGIQTSVYTSIWRLEAPDTWRIIFDKGNKYCE